VYRKKQSLKNKKFTIVYAGALIDIYNFKSIFGVIEKTGKKYQWIFAGYGPNENKIKELAEDSRYDVKYLGVVNHDEVVKLQKRADLLLCLRLNRGSKVNRYSARYATSGKLSEYLCAGKPILSTDIPAVSPQFKPFLNFAKDLSAKGVQLSIDGICQNYSEKLETAAKGQKFALSACDNRQQATGINDYLHGLKRGE
jgi:glycosyltransferase involved in cell wall biosynthesis